MTLVVPSPCRPAEGMLRVERAGGRYTLAEVDGRQWLPGNPSHHNRAVPPPCLSPMLATAGQPMGDPAA